MPVITIARQFGAGGETVGQMVATRLGAEFLDREIIAEVASRLQLADADVEEHDEATGGFLSRLLTALGSASVEYSAPPEVAAWSPPYTDPAFNPGKAVLQLTQEVIREAARTGNVVIVGRGSAYILRDLPEALHVFLRADVESKLVALKHSFGYDAEKARQRMKQVDANRAAYIRQLYGHDWAHPSHYDVVLDTGRLGYERASAALLAAVGGGG
jgi:cytidylate kinase